jgi:hypothetical protein
MREEVEFKWLVLLRNNNKFKKSILPGRTIGGFKTDFEKVCNITEGDKSFREFLSELIKEGVLEFFEKRQSRGGYFDTFIINNSFLDEKIKQNSFYEPVVKYMENKFLLRTAT